MDPTDIIRIINGYAFLVTQAMKSIWAPWRMDYILADKQAGCFLCDLLQEDRDRDNLILLRAEHAFVVMNKYPYNNGHLMIAPYRHCALMEDLIDDESLALMQLTQRAVRVMKAVIKANGFNVGINLGKAAGAGLEEHLHIHVVPRWDGDTNFMPVLADTKVMPQALYEMYDQLHPAFQAGA